MSCVRKGSTKEQFSPDAPLRPRPSRDLRRTRQYEEEVRGIARTWNFKGTELYTRLDEPNVDIPNGTSGYDGMTPMDEHDGDRSLLTIYVRLEYANNFAGIKIVYVEASDQSRDGQTSAIWGEAAAHSNGYNTNN